MSFQETRGNLFDLDDSFSLAHCVSRDLAMGKGIAKEFKDRFGCVDYLRNQNPQIGGLCSLQVQPGQYVFYLVTKERYFHKPTYDSLRSSLESLLNNCQYLGVTRLGIPKIGCGLDKLNWNRVKEITGEVFAGSNIEIVAVLL